MEKKFLSVPRTKLMKPSLMMTQGKSRIVVSTGTLGSLTVLISLKTPLRRSVGELRALAGVVFVVQSQMWLQSHLCTKRGRLCANEDKILGVAASELLSYVKFTNFRNTSTLDKAITVVDADSTEK